MTKQAIAGFERSYLASFEDRYDKPALFAAATLLFELRCTAVLLTMQKGKVDLTRQRMPIARDQSLGNRLANRFTVPLLEMGKRWLFLQLVRELP